ncbi:SDR family NAD(P)-dependent oxidoreductase [Bowdeniella massiliensis]|uniref:SDR family NAD(P)-dependent oxidoreductase n=1 Tax=Bowdeniella massiliensis TaxID=2932264 RepID=UPI002028C7A0|nr:SDR family NAD(P)-dependent oxidoreductase [Bowdeniella massiliensis]
MSETTRHALVTGASTGIGYATAARLSRAGWKVTATARRRERLQALREDCGCDIHPADLTDPDAVGALVTAAEQAGPIDALINVAGGALGVDTIADADLGRWQTMYDRNVLATLALTQAVLPAMRERGHGDLVFLTSTAAHDTYPGGGGYVAAKHAERIIPNTLRQELNGENIRIIEIAPGMVKTEEFSLNRLGDQAKADAVYAGVAAPLTADDIAHTIEFALTVPEHVNIDSMIIRPVAQATNTLVHRTP